MEVTVNGEKMQLVGNPPADGTEIPHFKLFDAQNQRVKTRELLGQPTVFLVVPDLNTATDTEQVAKFQQLLKKFNQVRLVVVSTNTVAEQQAWATAHQISGLELLSDYEQSFGYALKLLIPDEGVLARAVIAIDNRGQIVYQQVVSEITQEPDYTEAATAVEKLAQAK